MRALLNRLDIALFLVKLSRVFKEDNFQLGNSYRLAALFVFLPYVQVTRD
jgi:hypothetical protein